MSAMTVEFIKYPFLGLEDLSGSDYNLNFYPGGFGFGTMQRAEKDSVYRKAFDSNYDPEDYEAREFTKVREQK